MAYFLESSSDFDELLASPVLLSQKRERDLHSWRSHPSDALTLQSVLWSVGEPRAGQRRWAHPGNERRGWEGVQPARSVLALATVADGSSFQDAGPSSAPTWGLPRTPCSAPASAGRGKASPESGLLSSFRLCPC